MPNVNQGIELALDKIIRNPLADEVMDVPETEQFTPSPTNAPMPTPVTRRVDRFKAIRQQTQEPMNRRVNRFKQFQDSGVALAPIPGEQSVTPEQPPEENRQKIYADYAKAELSFSQVMDKIDMDNPKLSRAEKVSLYEATPEYKTYQELKPKAEKLAKGDVKTGMEMGSMAIPGMELASTWGESTPRERAVDVGFDVLGWGPFGFLKWGKQPIKGIKAAKSANILRPASTVAKVATKVEPVIKENPESTFNTIQSKLATQLKTLKTQRKLVEVAKHENIIPKVGNFADRLNKAETIEDVKNAFSATMRGRILPKGMEAKPLIESLSDDETKFLIDYVTNHPAFAGKPLTAANTLLALAKKETPTLGELKDLRKVLGNGFVNSYLELAKKHGWAKAAQLFSEIVNIPKAIFSGFDFAGNLRQAVVLSTTYPLRAAKSILTGTQAYLRSSKWVSEVDDAIRNSPYAPFREKLDLTDLPAAERDLSKVEEAYQTSILYRIPVIKQTLGELVKRSERVFTLTLNKLRADIFDDYARVWTGKATQKEYDELAELINVLSGRGAIGNNQKLRAIVTHTNTIFFSPRLNISRVQGLGLPLTLWKYSPRVRKVALRNIVSFVGGIGGVLALIKAASVPGVTVETDSRSTDYGMLKIGDTRYDPWGGHVQFARLAARLLSGNLKTSTGEVVSIDRFDELIKAGRMKLSPVMSLIVDMLKGETVIGEEVFKKENVGQQLYSRLTPGSIQDLVDAVKLYGMPQGLMGLPSSVSIGVNTYPSKVYMDWVDRMEKIQGQEWETDDISTYRPLFNNAEREWYDYLQLSGAAARNYYRKQNPKIEASMYFWGEISTLSTKEAKVEFLKLLDKFDLPQEAFPVRSKEPYESKGGGKDFDYYANKLPSYASKYVLANRAKYQGQDMMVLIKKLEDMKDYDQPYLDNYELMTTGEEPEFGQKMRKGSPEIDAAVVFWNSNIKTTYNSMTKDILRQKAKQLGIPESLVPALAQPALTPKSSTAKRTNRWSKYRK